MTINQLAMLISLTVAFLVVMLHFTEGGLTKKGMLLFLASIAAVTAYAFYQNAWLAVLASTITTFTVVRSVVLMIADHVEHWSNGSQAWLAVLVYPTLILLCAIAWSPAGLLPAIASVAASALPPLYVMLREPKTA